MKRRVLFGNENKGKGEEKIISMKNEKYLVLLLH